MDCISFEDTWFILDVFVVDRRDARRELKVLMQPTGLALLENEMKQAGTRGSKDKENNGNMANVTTLNETFDNGNFTTDYQLGQL